MVGLNLILEDKAKIRSVFAPQIQNVGIKTSLAVVVVVSVKEALMTYLSKQVCDDCVWKSVGPFSDL